MAMNEKRKYIKYPNKEAAKKAHAIKAKRHWTNVRRVIKNLPPLPSADTSFLTGSQTPIEESLFFEWDKKGDKNEK